MTIKLSDLDPAGFFALTELARGINKNAHDKGFYDESRSFGEAIALMHSELSEALEEVRDGNPGVWFLRADGVRFMAEDTYLDPETFLVYDQPDGPEQGHKPLKPEGAEVELIDAMIRILDTLSEMGANTDYLVALKTAYNSTRPYLHGKEF